MGAADATPNTPPRPAPEWVEYDCTGLGRKVKYRLDTNVANFQGLAGIAWVIMAANPHLSLDELLSVMDRHRCYRTRGWVYRRRWVFLPDAHEHKTGGRRRDEDGQYARAREIMDEHTHVSARELSRILKEYGIKRGKDWVIRHRVSHNCPIVEGEGERQRGTHDPH
jgi:hypothetical protein